MKKIKFFTVAVILTLFSANIQAQFSVGADVVSSYVWRGVVQGGYTPNIQPSLSYTAGGFTLGAWGSSSFTGEIKEVDLYASYALNDMFTVMVTDYQYNDPLNNYFKYNGETGHIFEGTINYAGVSSFPLSLSLNTMFYGADKKPSDDTKQAYSTYMELGYPVSDNVSLFLGAALNESNQYSTDGFGVTNVGVKITKEIPITDKFSLPVFGVLGFNPNAKGAIMVAGFSL